MKSARIFLACFLVALTCAACSAQTSSPAATSAPAATLALSPYWTPTSTGTATPPPAGTATPLPSPTPTYGTHIIKAGDTFSVIAFNAGVSVQSLATANPQVNPSMLIVGTPLVIPPVEPGAYSTPGLATPTAMALDLRSPNCIASAEGGLWCFVQVTNTQAGAVESVSVAVRMADPASGAISSQNGIAPLNIIPAGGSLPVAVYFPAPVPQPPYQMNVELTSALPVPEGDARYPAAVVENSNVEIAADGLSAVVGGAARLADAAAAASSVRVLAAAYNAAGQVIGLRWWDSTGGITAGGTLPFQFTVYSAGGQVARVELYVEGRK